MRRATARLRNQNKGPRGFVVGKPGHLALTVHKINGDLPEADFGPGMIWEQRCVDVIPNKTVQRSEQLGLIPELASLRESRRSEP